MATYALALISLLVLGATLPYLVRLVSRIVSRVPILRALAAVGLLVVAQPGSADPTPQRAPHAVEQSLPWAENAELQRHTADEDLVEAYRAERARFGRELDAATRRIKDLIGV